MSNEQEFQGSLLNNEEENSIIIWYDNQNLSYNGSVNHSNGINEDFIEIDIVPDSHDSVSENDSEEIDVVTGLSNHIESSQFESLESNERMEDSRCEVNNAMEVTSNNRRSTCESFNEINHVKTPKTMMLTSAIKPKFKFFHSKLLEINIDHVLEFCKSLPVSCYIEGLVAILKLFNRLDSCLEKFATITNSCRCIPGPPSHTPWSQYILEAAGAMCQQCSMPFLLHHLNNTFLRGAATASFLSVREIINCNDNNNADSLSNIGWFRTWATDHLAQGHFLIIIYTDPTSEYQTIRKKVMTRLVRGCTESEFQLSLPEETLTDRDIETRLLREETVKIPKSCLFSCQQVDDDFNRLYSVEDPRFREINVLGQVVAAFREKDGSCNAKGGNNSNNLRPEEVRYIRVPNMHLNGVLLVVPCLPLPINTTSDICTLADNPSVRDAN